MRASFEQNFRRKHPDMSLDGPTARDEWAVWQDGFIAGILYAFRGSAIDKGLEHLIEHASAVVDQAEVTR